VFSVLACASSALAQDEKDWLPNGFYYADKCPPGDPLCVEREKPKPKEQPPKPQPKPAPAPKVVKKETPPPPQPKPAPAPVAKPLPPSALKPEKAEKKKECERPLEWKPFVHPELPCINEYGEFNFDLRNRPKHAATSLEATLRCYDKCLNEKDAKFLRSCRTMDELRSASDSGELSVFSFMNYHPEAYCATDKMKAAIVKGEYQGLHYDRATKRCVLLYPELVDDNPY
jgi:hypothetical protein